MQLASFYVPHLMFGYGTAYLLIVAICRAQAGEIAERLRRSVADRKEMPGEQQVTVSIGIAENLAGDCPEKTFAKDCQEKIPRRSDEALYHSKQAGRNQVTAHTSLLNSIETFVKRRRSRQEGAALLPRNLAWGPNRCLRT